MITLPITCKQGGIILLCAMFAGGFYMMHGTYLENVFLFTLGMFVAGFPTVIGLIYLIWYGGVFISNNVQCKCDG